MRVYYLPGASRQHTVLVIATLLIPPQAFRVV